MTGITVTQRNGNLLACKTAQADEADRLRHEAQLLRHLEHPGIVQFIDFVEGPTVELYMGFVGPDSWATQPPNTSSDSIEALASAASTVADLHKLGTVHGAICPEHVLVAPDKRPILCGLADATAATESGCAQDLAGLGALIDHLAANCDAKESRQLNALARRAERGSVTASDLTAELNRMHGASPRLTTRLKRTPISMPAKRVVGLAGVVVAIAVVGWMLLKPSAMSDTSVANPAPLASTQGTDSAPSTTTQTTSTAPTTSTAFTTSTAPTRSTAATTTDDVNTAENPLVVTHNGRRYGVGQAGDMAILGDWSCDGIPTLALLQPSTGVIAVFATWPAPSEQLEASYVTVIDGATDLRNDPTAGCDHLRVIHPSGSTLINPNSQ